MIVGCASINEPKERRKEGSGCNEPLSLDVLPGRVFLSAVALAKADLCQCWQARRQAREIERLEDFVMKSLTVIAALLVLAAGASGAIVPIGSISAVASSSWWEGPCVVESSYDGSGMISATEHEGIWYPSGNYGDMWLIGGNPTSNPPDGIYGGASCMGYAHYSFDASYWLDEILIWNIGGASNALSAATVYIELSDVVSPSSAADWTEVFSGVLTQGPPTDGETGPHGTTDVLDAGDLYARHVAVSMINSWYNYPPLGTVYGGISEIQFVLVPEPVTLAVLALGGCLALLRRRRR